MSAPIERMKRYGMEGQLVAREAALARENALLEALKECRTVLVTDNEYPEDSLSVMRIDNVIRQIEETQ
jgi:hypothetical protein